jgi:hypothetical protein
MATRTSTRARATFDLTGYSAELESFLSELSETYYLNWSGQRDEMVLEPIYARHPELFTRKAVDALRRAADGDTEAAHQARLLHGFALESYLEREVVRLTEQIETAETQAVVVWRGERLPYRVVPIRVAEIADRAERNALYARYLEAVELINPLREERLTRQHQLAGELGYDSYLELARAVRGFDPTALAVELQAFLAESETVYFAALRRYLALIDIEQGDASYADLGHLLRGASWDAWFDSRRMVEVLRATLAGLGIDLARQKNVTLDLEARPHKSPRAFCAAVRVPGDVRLSIQPRGGWDDFGALLHEAGHLEHYAHVDAALPAAYRLLGDPSVTEGYAALLEYVLPDPAWLRGHTSMTEDLILGFGDFAAFWRLYMARRYVAKLLYELRLHDGGETALNRAYYAGLLSLLTGVNYPEAQYVADLDDHFYAAAYLRSWLFEASLSAALRRRHGEAWWQDPAAGETLRRAWSRGQEWKAEDVVAHLGYDRLDWRPVLRQIRTRLIGEMSGYGGPNITTRAGTRKV